MLDLQLAHMLHIKTCFFSNSCLNHSDGNVRVRIHNPSNCKGRIVQLDIHIFMYIYIHILSIYSGDIITMQFIQAVQLIMTLCYVLFRLRRGCQQSHPLSQLMTMTYMLKQPDGSQMPGYCHELRLIITSNRKKEVTK